MKKALAYIGGPRQLQDFIWYYLAYGKEYEWDLVCQPMVKEMKLEEICRRSGLFKNIYVPDSFFYQPRGKLAKIGLKMSLYWLVGQKKIYARKEINKIMDINQYEHMYLSTTRGVTCGLMALCAEGISIDLMEDGNGDNVDSHARFDVRRIKEKNYLPAYAFAKMGYFNIGGMFPLKSMKKCVRFSEEPEKLSKELYKSVKSLNDMELVNQKEYEDLIKRVYGELRIDKDVDGVLFTASLKDFTEAYEPYIEKTIEYLKKQGFHKILLKKHPRDMSDYTCENLEMKEVDPMIPAENVLEKVKSLKLIFMYPSTTIRSISDKTENVILLKYTRLALETRYGKYFEKTLEDLGICNGKHVEVVEI